MPWPWYRSPGSGSGIRQGDIADELALRLCRFAVDEMALSGCAMHGADVEGGIGQCASGCRAARPDGDQVTGSLTANASGKVASVAVRQLSGPPG
jgi:hypothetical protein